MAPIYKLSYFDVDYKLYYTSTLKHTLQKKYYLFGSSTNTILQRRGAAEPIRLIFAYKGIEYTDIRHTYETTWPEKKNGYINQICISWNDFYFDIFMILYLQLFLYQSETPWGALPILEIDDKVLAQSQAIQRYLAKLYKLEGETEFHAAKCDELVSEQINYLPTSGIAYFISGNI